MIIVKNLLLIVIAVLLFGFVIFFHEFGHFFTAKLCKIRVNEFAVGMGPKIFSKVKGETRYSLRLLPIGGYCAMEGEDEESSDIHAFGNRPVWQRMIVIVAGGIMNILLGIIMMGIVLSTEGDFLTTQIKKFAPESAMTAAGMQVGDVVTRIDGYKVITVKDLSFGLAMADPESVDIEVKRNGETLAFNDIKMNTKIEGGEVVLAQDLIVSIQKSTIKTTLQRSFTETYSTVRMVFATLKGILSGKFGLNDMAGPVGTAQVISQAASAGLMQGFGTAVYNIVTVIILVTVNLGIVNLLPLPALDGGRLLFLIFEAIFRKPVPAKYEGWVHTAGFALLMVLMIVLTFNDIVRIITGG